MNSAVADGSALGANAIGSTWGSTGTDPNAGLQALAHGALGCAEAGLTGGDCAAGAAGAAAESVLGHVVTAAGGLSTEASGNVSTAAAATYETGAAVLGALAGQAAGGDAQSGVNTAVNAAANNYLSHPQIVQKHQALAQAVTQKQKDDINAQYAALDAQQQQNATACQGAGTGCTFANTVPALHGVLQGLDTQAPGCAIPSTCAADVQQSQQQLQGVLTGSGITTPIYPVETAVAAVAMAPLVPVALDLATGPAATSLLTSRTGVGVMAAAINAGAQYVLTGNVNPVDVFFSGTSGFAGTYGGLIFNGIVGATTSGANTFADNKIYGNQNSVVQSMIVGGLANMVGYGLTSVSQSAAKSMMHPTINSSDWQDIGNGISKFVGGPGAATFTQNNYPVLIGNFLGATAAEATSDASK